MIRKDFVITNEVGLHARPAMLFVKEAKQFTSSIMVSKNQGKAINAKNILQLLTLGVMCGETIEVEVSGEDEREAMTSIEQLVMSGFHE